MPLLQHASKHIYTPVWSDDINAVSKGQKEGRKTTPPVDSESQDCKLQKGPDRKSPITDWKE